MTSLTPADDVVVAAVVVEEDGTVDAGADVDVFLSAYSMQVQRPLFWGSDVSIFTTWKNYLGLDLSLIAIMHNSLQKSAQKAKVSSVWV